MSPHAIALLVRLEADADREASTAPRFSKGQIQPDKVDEGSAQFQGRVVSSFFLGDHTRLVIDVGGESMLIARVQQREKLRAGEVVHCAVDPRAVMALAAASE